MLYSTFEKASRKKSQIFEHRLFEAEAGALHSTSIPDGRCGSGDRRSVKKMTKRKFAYVFWYCPSFGRSLPGFLDWTYGPGDRPQVSQNQHYSSGLLYSNQEGLRVFQKSLFTEPALVCYIAGVVGLERFGIPADSRDGC